MPVEGEPNTFIDVRDEKTGKLHRSRKLNNDGKAYVDVEYTDHNKKHIPDPHAHNWDNKNRDEEHRDLTKEELKEYNKRKNKRRWFK